MNGQIKPAFQFGPFRINAIERTLHRHGDIVPLAQKAFDILLILVQNRGRVVAKEELMNKVWPDTFVEDNNLTVNMSALRKAIGDGADGNRFIDTLPRRGYRFVGPVTEMASAVPSPSWSGEPASGDADPLVGRDLELGKLNRSLHQAVNGSGSAVFLTGEPGMGKTALSDAFLRRAAPSPPAVFVGRGRCVEQYGTGEAYLPFLDALSDLLSGPARDTVTQVLINYAPTWCLQFPGVFGSTEILERLKRETIGATRQRMVREMIDALGAIAASSPLILHLEDLHWADPASVDLLYRLCQSVSRHRMLLLGTFRPGDVERANQPLQNYLLEMRAHKQCEEIALGLLTLEHVSRYLEARFSPHRFAPGFAVLIQSKTEGHPLFATSVVQFLVERGDIARRNGHWALTRPLCEMDLEAPASVRSMIVKKLQALDAEDRRALEYAGIEGEEFSSTVLARLLGTDEVSIEERLHRLDTEHRLIHTIGQTELPDGSLATRYRFAHVLYQNILYEGLVSKRKVLLHREAGEQLVRHYGHQAPRIAAMLAVHFEQGREFVRAVEYLLHAGDNASRVCAHEKAVEHYSRALSLAAKLPPGEQGRTRAIIHRKLGAAHFVLSLFDDAVADYNRMLHEARALEDAELEHTALNGLAEVYFYSHRLDELLAAANEALGIAARLGNERLRIETLTFLAMRLGVLGELVEARKLLDEILTVATALGHRSGLLGGLAWRGQLFFFQSEYDQACHTFSRAVDLASELRHEPLLLQGLFFLALSQGNLGLISEALFTLHRAEEMARRNGNQYWLAKIPNCIAWLHREIQDLEGAFSRDRDGLVFARQTKVAEAESNCLINLGFDYSQTGEGQNSQHSFAEAEELLRRDPWCRWRFLLRWHDGLAGLLLKRGEFEKAARHAFELLDHAARVEVPKYVAVAHKHLAEIAIARANLPEAESHLNQACEQAQTHSMPLAAWKIYAALGRLRLQAGHDSSARQAFEQAAAIIQSIAGHVDDEQLRAKFLGSTAVQDVLDRLNRYPAGTSTKAAWRRIGSGAAGSPAS